ncbi:MAG: hypothetical protein J7639_24755 [Paenibacillaceae bacterium]|nr:hypothetical protein [Paenibacillaceae bacterium]
MKHGKNPTRRQRLTIAAAKLSPDNWLVTKNHGGRLHLVHRITGKERIISA